MKLAVISSDIRGEIDTLISNTATKLCADGVRLSGVTKILQENVEEDHDCDMDLHVWPDGAHIRITQSLGKGSTSCRLNPAAIAAAVAAVEEKSSEPFDLFILNKFGPQEAEGRGFCAAIGAAMERGIPVLVGVGEGSREAFDAFADGMAENLSPNADVIYKWCHEALAESA